MRPSTITADPRAPLPTTAGTQTGTSGFDQSFLIRGAYVMSMDPATKDIQVGDVFVRDGRIAAVAPSLDAEGATIIDAHDMVLLPGFVDAHTHFWTTQMRGLFGDTPETIYFLTRNRLARAYHAEDMHLGTLLGAVESLYGGITTAADFCHNVRSETYAHECIRALAESGLRARYLYGPATTMTPSDSMDLASVERTNSRWSTLVGDAPVTLGIAWRGPNGTTTSTVGQQLAPVLSVAKAEFDAAKRLGLPLSVHVSGKSAERQFNAIAAEGFLDPSLHLVHMSNMAPAQLAQAARAGASVCLTPVTELRVGYGVTQLQDFIDSGVRLSFGVDSNALAGSADMFQVMRLFRLIECGRSRNELAVRPRQLLEMATIGGACSLGVDNEIGSITVGKKADLQLVNLRAINLGPFGRDPAHLLVEAARPENVDTVMVGGQLLKRHGVMVRHDVNELVSRAGESIRRVLQRAEASG